MKSINDTYTLSNGLEIPCLGFGTYNPTGGDNVEIILTAMECGYRYFDTASLYGTERALGEAVKKSGIARGDLFIASKAWIDEMGYEEVKQAFERTLNRLQTDYLDLYLIHWPRSAEDDTDWKEKGRETWRAMEELYEAGKIKGLGLSNFLPHHMDNILQNCKVKPVADQLELHPGYMQQAATAFCAENQVAVQAWSPLGRAKLLEDSLLLKMAAKYGKSPAQICLRYLLQKGMIPLVKATKAERMKQNADVFDFEIEKDDMWMLDCMPQTAWSGEHPDFAIPKVKSNFEQ
ncbi:MAG: aldo/keto reductase [Lachnospiraceae bacterium]|nr:aldo/keto reductase [Lachnospiraceae bacterium]